MILSQIFRGFASAVQDKAELDPGELATAFEEAANAAYRAVSKPTEGTILTVARGVAEFAVAADMNPGTSGGTVNVASVTTTSSASDMKNANSRNHDGDGQNILYGDGHVSFEQNPFVGVHRDNIFTTKANSSAFTGGPVIASPFDANDSILLPTE